MEASGPEFGSPALTLKPSVGVRTCSLKWGRVMKTGKYKRLADKLQSVRKRPGLLRQRARGEDSRC